MVEFLIRILKTSILGTKIKVPNVNIVLLFEKVNESFK